MISLLQRKSFKYLHPILKRLVNFYLKKPRPYRFEDIRIIVHPSIFHPGLFYSTKFLISFLKKQNLHNRRVLELGAGSGLISLFCAKQGAIVTSTDINEKAVIALRDNAHKNQCELNVLESDLFENISPNQFDLIAINPPYYPKNLNSDSQAAWYCGENFEYFMRLFKQLQESLKTETEVIMVLSEDCDIKHIKEISKNHRLFMTQLEAQKIGGEMNYIFQIKKS